MYSSSRRLVCGVLTALTAVVVLASPPVTAPANAATTSYTSGGPVSIGGSSDTLAPSFGVDLPDGEAELYPHTANRYEDGLAGTITDVNLTLHALSHDRPQDLDVMLVNNSTGARAIVMSDAGGATPVSGLTFTLDDQADASLPVDLPPVGSDAYRPVNAGSGDAFPYPALPATGVGSGLSAFNGTDGNGSWSLYIVDDTGGATGSLAGWSVDIETTGTAPYPSTLQVSGAAGQVTDVDVSLSGLSHVGADQVDLLLVGPGGAQTTILSDVPAVDSPSAVDLTLDDEAPSYLSQLVAGRYKPTNNGALDKFPAPAPTAGGAAALSVFDGTDPNGPWRLFALDDTSGGRGSVRGWSLQITTTAPADTTAPRVTSTAPASGATGVGRAANVRATLTELVQPGTVTVGSAFLVRSGTTTRVPATVTWRSDTRTIVIDPSSDLAGRTTYKATIATQVLDLAGNPLDQDPALSGRQPKTWTFTTS